MPALIDGEARIFDSTIILEYLEDKHPSPALLPRDPAARADARMIEEVCDTLYEAINWGLGEIGWFKRAEGEAGRRDEGEGRRRRPAAPGLARGQARQQDMVRRRFRLGRSRASRPISTARSHYGIGPAAGSPLGAWHKRLCRRPSVAATFKESRPRAKAWPTSSSALASGAFRREYRDHRLEWMMKSGGVQIVLDGLAKDNIRFTWPLGRA